jgi:[ribosomal protein S18]-alanine N-acetyltransferase
MKASAGNIQIRRMAAEDLPRVTEIAATLPDAPHWTDAAYTTAMNSEATPRRIALVAAKAHEGRPLGFAVASLLPPQAEMETIAVVAESQRSGLGGGLLAALVDELGAAGVTELLLEVRASNQVALRFYRAHGFVETGRRLGYYSDPVEDAVLMQVQIE